MINNSSGPESPFLKWAGGKQWLAPLLKPTLLPVLRCYHEPFLGGGAVFFALLPSSAWLSDSNGDLIDTYLAIKEDAESVIEHLETYTFTKECFYRVRASNPRSLAKRAARFIYLNRTCWNGLYRVNRRGEFNVPKGTFPSKPDFVVAERLRNAQRALSYATLTVSDFEAVCDRARPGDTVFMDPPYTVTHRNNGFLRYNESIFSWTDQERLAATARTLDRRGCRLIVANADHPSILRLYRGFKIQRMFRRSLVASQTRYRRRISELLISNDLGASI